MNENLKFDKRSGKRLRKFENVKDLLQDFIDKGIRMQGICETAQQKTVLPAQNNARTGGLSRK
jgi:hypothetical protein